MRPSIDQVTTNTGKKVRLHRLLHGHGVGNGTVLFMPYDHGLEHGPRDFTGAEQAADPGYVIKLAVDGGMNAVALQIGNAEKYYPEYAGRIPLLLKLNGKTELPPDDAPISPLNATVEDAVRLGADAVGYTLYVGSPRQDEDFVQLRGVREESERYGLPLVIWAYPRGSAVKAKGGRDSFYAIDYATRVAAELGADMVKVNWPNASARDGVPAAYDREFTEKQALDAVMASAGRSLVLLSGGEKADDAEVVAKAQAALEAGATGMIFGRNVWQRPRDEALRFIERIRDLLGKY
jgi:fructose-bisphosphate aldolase, class I